MSHLCSRWSNGSWFHYEFNPRVYIDFRDSTWSSVLLTSCPARLFFSSSHCFSYSSNTPGSSTLPPQGLCTCSCTSNIFPSQPSYLHDTFHFLWISAQMLRLSESSSLINPQSSLSFLFPYAALYLSITLITTCHIFIGLFVYCLSPQAGL